MRKIALLMLVAISVTTVSGFAADKNNGKKITEKNCTMGGTCCKKTSRTALLKAKVVTTKPAAKKA